MTITAGDTVTIEYTGRFDDGQIFDTSREPVAAEVGLDEAQPDREYEALTFEVGAGEVIAGLDDGILGCEVGDTPTFVIPPEEAYGEHDDELLQAYDAEQFIGMLDGQVPAEGDRVETERGDVGRITHVDDDVIRLDFNHALAGETLEFDVEVVAVE